MKSENSCPTFLVPDAPSPSDDFGTHKAVAEAMARIVMCEEGGKSIALEGPWGSGKTTIVTFVRSRLENSEAPECAVVVFDAWAHEGDPLRRTFLERVITALQEKQWIQREKWEARREDLSKTRETTVTRNYPKFTSAARWIAVSLLFVPIGGAVFQDALKQNVTLRLDPHLPLATRFIVDLFGGLILSTLPFLIYLGAIARRRLGKRSQPGGNGTHSDSTKTADETDLLSMLISKSSSEVRTEVQRTPNITSIEFESTFEQLMVEGLSGSAEGNPRRLVLILDNLDRIGEDEAISVWSTLQTFFQYRHYHSASWFNRIWLIVPYDPAAVTRIWGGRDRGGDGKAFVDKTFQIRFEVPPLLLSDWRTYLIQKLRDALSQHDENEFHSVYRVYSIFVLDEGHLPTPRALKLFVNQIGVLHRIWNHTFPLSHLAYYAVKRHSGFDIPTGLLNATIPEPAYSQVLGERVAEDLAALTFYKERDVANQLLLHLPSARAIRERKASDLKRYSGLPGFWQVLERVVSGNEPEAISAGDLAYTLRASELLKEDRPEVRGIVGWLKRNSSRDPWTPVDARMIEGALALFEVTSDLDLATTVLKRVTGNMTGESSTVPEALDGRKNAQLLLRMIPQLDTYQMLEAYVKGVLGAITGCIRDLATEPSLKLPAQLELLFELGIENQNAAHALRDVVLDGTSGLVLTRLTSAAAYKGLGLVIYVTMREILAPASEGDASSSAVDRNLFTLAVEQATPGVVESFVGYAERRKDSTTLFAMVEKVPESRAFVSSALDIASEKATSLLSAPVVVENWSFINSEMGKGDAGSERLNRLIGVLLERDALPKYLVERSEFRPKLGSLYRRIMALEQHLEDDFFRWLRGGLSSFSISDWLSDMEAGGALLGLSADLIDSGLEPPTGVEEALVEAAKTIAKPQGSVNTYLESGAQDLLGRMFASDHGKRLAAKVYAIAVDAGGNAAPQFFEIFGAAIGEHALGHTNGGFLTTLVLPLIRARNAGGLKWAKDFLAKHKVPASLSNRPEAFQQVTQELDSAIAQRGSSPQVEGLIVEVKDALRTWRTG